MDQTWWKIAKNKILMPNGLRKMFDYVRKK